VSQKNLDAKLGVNQLKHSVATSEQRRHYRHPIHWRIAIVHKNGDKNDIYHGRTHDLSAWGASVFVDHNIFMMSEVVMLLAIPPLHPGQKETIIEIQCRMVHTVLDSEKNQFRIGIHFLQFKGEDKHILSDILSKRDIPKPEPKSYGAV
jgi:c-di-GMP-binding flagellar brake protein YcgR